MSLSPGTQLGPYEILVPIGAGGMGEVYRARDTRLGRDVAVKVSKEQFSERFEREARTVASLNHLNICTLFDVGPNYLVMELVEGPTLADRIQEGIIPLEEALPIARQIAEALEAAHEKGIVHRDLKPGNIKIRPDGTVKVLDFGLARVAFNSTEVTSDSPTIMSAPTQIGMILGTAAYMSPEQARGKLVDKRADIWAFGVILHEMVTGKRLFEGEDLTEILASVVKDHPDLSAAPPRIQRLLRKCLEKDPKKRLRDISGVELLLQEEPPTSPAASSPVVPLVHRSGWMAVSAVLALSTVVLTLVLWAPWRAAPGLPQPARLQLSPENITFDTGMRFALSPDGTKLAWFAAGEDGVTGLWIRAMDTLQSRPLPATDAGSTLPFFWSWDSRYVAFFTGRQLRRIDVSGGAQETLCDAAGISIGGSWNREGVILFGSLTGPVMRVSQQGGAAAAVTALDPARQETGHMGPLLLPDGHHFLYLRAGNAQSTGIYVGSLDLKPDQQDTKPLLATRQIPGFVPERGGKFGQVLFLRDGTLLAQEFDVRRLRLAGQPVPLAEQVANYGTGGAFSASAGGNLVYRSGNPGGRSEDSALTWFDRAGKLLGTPSDPVYLANTVSVSPDGSTVAAVRRGAIAGNLWLLDLSRGTHTRFTYSQNGPGEFNAVWSPDGARIAFASATGGRIDLYQRPSNGSSAAQLLLTSDTNKYPSDWSRDGRVLLYNTPGPKGKLELWGLPMNGPEADRKPFSVLSTGFNEAGGRFSPDSHWIADASDESGQNEIYVRPFPPSSGGGGKTLISQGDGGGHDPRWSKDGKELFYLTRTGAVMVSAVSMAGTGIHAGVPSMLFDPGVRLVFSPGTLLTTTGWDVAADGKRFLLLIPAQRENTKAPFNVVLNWTSLLKQ